MNLPRLVSRSNRPLVFLHLLRRGWFGRVMEKHYSFGTVTLYFRFAMTNGAPVLDALDASTERGSPELIMYLASVCPASPLTLFPGPTPSHVHLFYVLYFSCTRCLYRMCICTGIVNYVCSYREHCYWLEVAGRSTPCASTINSNASVNV